ncbi:MAG TPA: hypothetical protein PKL84_05960 [Candidatus Hydrogenedentes bacterium]|nr:hypothetical protein [Candidatus Hydrogenedentota bacterium]
MDAAKLKTLAEDLEIRQGVRDFVNRLRRMDQSTVRAEGEPGRVERLREAVLKRLTGDAVMHDRKAESDDDVHGELRFHIPGDKLARLQGQPLFVQHPDDADSLVRIGSVE